MKGNFGASRIEENEGKISRLKEFIDGADAVVVGAGAGLSASAGFTYAGKRFHENFSDFEINTDFTICIRADFIHTIQWRNIGRIGRAVSL